jgi:RimJ/RimL family protein N-acetyltransferase
MVVASRTASSWGPRQIVTTADGLVVGTIGFMGRPEAVAGTPEAEVGYGLVPSARRGGLATEALAAIVAAAEQVSVAVRATVAADNAASRRVLDKCGFTLAGTSDDGQLVMRREAR